MNEKKNVLLTFENYSFSMKKNIFLLLLLFWFSNNLSFSQYHDTSELKFYGSIRFRAQIDRDSESADKGSLPDTENLKLRFRFGLKYYKKHWKAAARIRTGNPAYPQNADVILGSSFTGKEFYIDKAYIQYSNNGFFVWIGKNTLNMWQPDQILWDVDVNPEGIALKKKFYFQRAGKINLYGGYYIFNNYRMNSNENPIKNNSSIFVTQVKYSKFIFNKLHLSIAPGWLHTNFDTANNNFNYQIFMSYVELMNVNGDFKVIADFFHNFNNYSEQLEADFNKQKTGYAFELKYFSHRKFSTTLKYAYIEKYAVIDHLSQNDWVRENTKIIDNNNHMVYQYAKASNFQGINISVKYNIVKDIHTEISFWQTQGIKKANGDKELDSNTRLRWDFIYKF